METNSEGKRRRRSSAEVTQLVAEYEQSGMAQTEFCQLHDLALSTLARCLRRRRTATSANRLVGVDVIEKNSAYGRGHGSGLEVMLAHGRRIEVGADFDSGALQRLIKVLERI
jgi:hypothetical protein